MLKFFKFAVFLVAEAAAGKVIDYLDRMVERVYGDEPLERPEPDPDDDPPPPNGGARAAVPSGPPSSTHFLMHPKGCIFRLRIA